MWKRLVVCAERIMARHYDGGGGRWWAKRMCRRGTFCAEIPTAVRVNDDNNVRNAVYHKYQRGKGSRSANGERTNKKTRL